MSNQIAASAERCEYKETISSKIQRMLFDIRDGMVHNMRNACERLKWIGYKPGNSEIYAREELQRAGWFDDDAMYGDMMPNAVLSMIRQFSDEGHSGMSAGIAVNLFKDLAMFEPLTPLTGGDDEWIECGEGIFQNKRCSHVFKENDQAYDIDGRVFREPDGMCFTNRDSRVNIAFPYIPKREYVDVPESKQD